MKGLHSGYVAWFLGLTGALIVGDVLNLDDRFRGTLLLLFVLLEIVGAFLRRKPGDTWSEINWTLLRGRPALYPVAIGWVGWYVWQWVEVFPWEVDPGLICLAAGVMLWYPAHVIWEGRHG